MVGIPDLMIRSSLVAFMIFLCIFELVYISLSYFHFNLRFFPSYITSIQSIFYDAHLLIYNNKKRSHKIYQFQYLKVIIIKFNKLTHAYLLNIVKIDLLN